jgi:radical SAM protein
VAVHYRSEYRPARGGSYLTMDFNQSPFTVAWEITRACALACIHCRATAIPRRDPRELTTEEGFRLIDEIVEIGQPILVVTGGDPMMRRDVYDLLRYAVSRDLRVALSPSATALVTRRALEKVKATGVHMVQVSLDGSEPAIHDAFRGVAGAYQRTIEILRNVGDLEIPLQIGTTVTRHNLHDLARIAERVSELGATVWNVFFLVPTGRGQASDMITPEQHESVFNWLYDLSLTAPFHVRTTAAQHYRRVVIQRMRTGRGQGDIPSPSTWQLTGAGYSFRTSEGPAGRGVNDGSGFCFVSHVGDVFPSGFLQVSAGNVREKSLVEIYRSSSLFQALRDPDRLKGKCGRCEYRNVCGGSRARAYYVMGDYLESDPSCVYQPAAL